MVGPAPVEINLTPRQKQILEQLTRKRKAPADRKKRGRIVLLAYQGMNNTEIAEHIGTCRKTARKWRKRWATASPKLFQMEDANEPNKRIVDHVYSILDDKYRSGAPSKFKPEQLTQIYALACEPPSDSGLPLSHWTSKDLAEEAKNRGIVESISQSYLSILLKKADLKPHTFKYWETPPSTRS